MAEANPKEGLRWPSLEPSPRQGGGRATTSECAFRTFVKLLLKVSRPYSASRDEEGVVSVVLSLVFTQPSPPACLSSRRLPPGTSGAAGGPRQPGPTPLHAPTTPRAHPVWQCACIGGLGPGVMRLALLTGIRHTALFEALERVCPHVQGPALPRVLTAVPTRRLHTGDAGAVDAVIAAVVLS